MITIQSVSLLSGLRNEPLTAYDTTVRSLPRVDFDVISVRRPVSEILAAVAAHEGFFSSVYPLMLLELILLREPLRTLKTSERSVPGVGSDVIFELFFCGDFLATNVTDHRPIGTAVVVVAVHVPL